MGRPKPAIFVVLASFCSAAAASTAAAAAAAAPRSFFVATSGDDAAAGRDAAHPWRSLARLANLSLAPGDAIYLRAGDEWAEPLVLGGSDGAGMAGCIDHLTCTEGGNCTAAGWALDCMDPVQHGAAGCKMPNSSAPLPPVTVSLQLDGVEVASSVAKLSRPDLVAARAAPDPLHGFNFAAQLGTEHLPVAGGHHRIAVVIVGCAGCGGGWLVPGSAKCVCGGGKTCPCPPLPPPGSGPPPPPPVRVLSTNASAPRPKIRLDGARTAFDESQWAVRISGIPRVSIEGLAIEHSTSGISVSSSPETAGMSGGAVEIKDCVFHGVWNRSSVGQRLPAAANQCSNGWSPCIMAGDVASFTVSGCLFDDFDVAFQPRGTIGRARFTGNTLTGGNGNVVFFTASHDWLLSHNVFSRDWAPRYFTCGETIGPPFVTHCPSLRFRILRRPCVRATRDN